MKNKKPYVVVCYALHERKFVSNDQFETEDEAIQFIRKDAKSVYDEEYENTSPPCRKDIQFDLEDGEAFVSSCDQQRNWFWGILYLGV